MMTESTSTATVTATAAMPQIALGPYSLSRLIVGANPFNGGTHLSRFLNLHTRRYFTAERMTASARGSTPGNRAQGTWTSIAGTASKVGNCSTSPWPGMIPIIRMPWITWPKRGPSPWRTTAR